MSFHSISFLEKTVLKQGQWGFLLPSLAKVNFELGHQGLNLASLTRSLLIQYFFYSTDHCLIQFSWRIVKWEVTTWKDWISKPCHIWAPLLFVYINLINIFQVKIYRTAVLCSSLKLLFPKPLCRQDAHHNHIVWKKTASRIKDLEPIF